MTEHGIAKEVEAFLLMWDAFPEPAMLVDDRRKVLAANALGRNLGITLGTTCGGLAPLEDSVLHNPMQQLRETRSALIEFAEVNGEPVLSYWVPVGGTGNMAMHFGIGVVRAIDAVGMLARTCNRVRATPSFPAGESFND